MIPKEMIEAAAKVLWEYVPHIRTKAGVDALAEEVLIAALSSQWRGMEKLRAFLDSVASGDLYGDEALGKAQELVIELGGMVALPSQWRGMESAPKDGTRVILLTPSELEGSRISIDWWDEKHNMWHNGRPRPGPTHWMPLPPPPAIQEGEK